MFHGALPFQIGAVESRFAKPFVKKAKEGNPPIAGGLPDKLEFTLYLHEFDYSYRQSKDTQLGQMPPHFFR
ncbi:hypothetical protein D3Z39_08545 [Anaerotruncus colihominis]|uniref:Uncharacterized protein n=1 Tax=Anaerotruncus colihominis TaxID=169435 RepID=A0A845RFN5_9FIRM|nr:hypothetical protein [Anaerotruncus colihominis]